MQFKSITSRRNPTVMWASSLQEKKYREKHEAFLVEGVKLFEEALTLDLPMTHIFVLEEKKEWFVTAFADSAYKDALARAEIFSLSASCFEKISSERAPQGVIAAIKYLDFFKRTDKIMSEDVSDRALFLSSVRDPGNLGAIIRSAVAFGTKTLILSSDAADIYHPKVLRAAMGALFRVRVLIAQDVFEMIRTLQRDGRRFFAAELRECALPLSAHTLRKNDIFVIGNEGHGIPAELSALCDGSVYIPIQNGVESLNASVAASVLLWEQSKCQ